METNGDFNLATTAKADDESCSDSTAMPKLQQITDPSMSNELEASNIDNNDFVKTEMHVQVDLLGFSTDGISNNLQAVSDCNNTLHHTKEVDILDATKEENSIDQSNHDPVFVDVSVNSKMSNGSLSNDTTIKVSNEILSNNISTNYKENVTTPLEHTPPSNDMHNDDNVVAALQENLQNQMNAKAEAEDKVRRMDLKITLLEEQLQKQADEMMKFDTLHENLQLQMNAKAEAEHKARTAYDRIQQLENEKDLNVQDLKRIELKLREAQEIIEEKDHELNKVRVDRDEYERKVTALTTRLNSTKKKEAVKVNLVDEIEDDLKVVSEELEQTKKELEVTKSERNILEQKLQYVEKLSKEHIEYLEVSLAEEQRLNEERKTKMMEYVEKKSEEIRQAKEENDALQIELSQTNRSLVELNNRWKQLHTQWVQAQTRNRELQRDLNRTKKDSEHLHKQGDTLEMKLSRSANETEEHKNKRLAAKQELMNVLRALELERDVTTKLRDQIKFTFVPKMLNQQQTLNDALHDFNASLEKLSARLGKPLLPPIEESERDETVNANSNGSSAKTTMNGDAIIHSDVNPLVDKLELECQHVTRSINAIVNNVERLRALALASGDRTCFTVLSELVSTGGMESSPAVQASRANMSNPLATIGRSHRYGQIPGTTSD